MSFTLFIDVELLCLKRKFNLSAMVQPQEQPKLSPPNEFGLPPHTTALTTLIGSGGYIFVVSFYVHYMFYEFFIAMPQILFHLNSYIPNREWQKLSQQTEFGLLPHTTTLPTSMGSDMIILKVRYNFLPFFRSCFFNYI
jgi:hypothetical protein